MIKVFTGNAEKLEADMNAWEAEAGNIVIDRVAQSGEGEATTCTVFYHLDVKPPMNLVEAVSPVPDTGRMESRLDVLTAKLDMYQDLQQNWDGHDGLPISGLALAQARQTLNYIFSKYDQLQAWVQPRNDSGLTIQYSHPISEKGEVFLIFNDKGNIQARMMNGPTKLGDMFKDQATLQDFIFMVDHYMDVHVPQEDRRKT